MPAHGLMFHHFHNEIHAPGQGSLSADAFKTLLEHLGPEHILPAEAWLQRATAGTLTDQDLCITFDDNLRCQYDIAYPILKAFNLTAFWFIYSSPLQGHPERLELYRYFRTVFFDSVESFYEAFFQILEQTDFWSEVQTTLKHFNPTTYLADYPFYTEADRQFRFIRDQALGPIRYPLLMDAMMAKTDLDIPALSKHLWMDADCLRQLDKEGHIIGLHSHSHSTEMEKLSYKEQHQEYSENYDCLTALLGKPPICMSHPCNSYNEDTLRILKDFKIQLGFRANMAKPHLTGLEYPREDHSNLMSQLLARSAS